MGTLKNNIRKRKEHSIFLHHKMSNVEREESRVSQSDSGLNVTRLGNGNEGRTDIQTHVLKIWESIGCTCFGEVPESCPKHLKLLCYIGTSCVHRKEPDPEDQKSLADSSMKQEPQRTFSSLGKFSSHFSVGPTFQLSSSDT